MRPGDVQNAWDRHEPLNPSRTATRGASPLMACIGRAQVQRTPVAHVWYRTRAAHLTAMGSLETAFTGRSYSHWACTSKVQPLGRLMGGALH